MDNRLQPVLGGSLFFLLENLQGLFPLIIIFWKKLWLRSIFFLKMGDSQVLGIKFFRKGQVWVTITVEGLDCQKNKNWLLQLQGKFLKKMNLKMLWNYI